MQSVCRKSLQGLDYFVADGVRAFEDLDNLVCQLGDLGLGNEWQVQQVELLKAAKSYIKGDFKVHVSNSSLVASHCSVFALSDTTNPDLQQQCDHSHDQMREQSESLHSTLHSITEAVKEASFVTEDDRNEAGYLANSATLSIKSWICHLLRSVHQDQARLDIIDTLDPEAVLIVNDWVMKFLPQRYRESQTEWFGKRGLSWHMSVVYRQKEGELQWQGFIHIIQSCSQGSSAVAAIMHHVLTTLKREHPEENKAYFCHDNAGCYHSSRTLLACREMPASTGVQVVRIDFSDPQGGKGAVDQLAATCKGHVRAFINEGHDVCTATDLRNALLSYGGLGGVQVVSLNTINKTPDDSRSISGITKLNNFQSQLPVGAHIPLAVEKQLNRKSHHLVSIHIVF
ncbi:uncharacterized protein LOC110047346 [Orbicella faveolata]|uniref:uncharacterized protein LOC110047335 n=1 Tax=Orbicella faveolata TaxID=48498 RepID=UPI0009E2FFA3|nr:uncharacterized protein LOC110047335 [Orbicella faveolata]XP_020608749.1 uncharacterized protein LOC110047346 [Orbicella faveolata]